MKGKFKFLFLISLFYYTCAFAQENTTVVASRIDSANSSEDVKIISFNIRNSTSPEQDGNNCWSNRRDGAVRVVSDELPDAFGIQEGTLHQVKYFEKYCPEYTRVGIGRDDGKDGGEFMAIFFLSSKYDLISCGTFWLSETPDTVSKGWDAACKRTATWVRLRNKSDGSELYYFNTHLDHMGVTARFESAKLLNSRIHKIAGDDAAVILGGDFNVSPENEVVAIFHSYLADSRDSAPVTDRKYTFNGFGNGSREQIDYILGRNVRFSIFRTLDGNYGVPYISDHYPVEAICRPDQR